MYLQGGLPQSKKGICAHSHADGPAACSSIQLESGVGKSTRELMYIRAVKYWCRQQHLRSFFCPHRSPALSSPERAGETKQVPNPDLLSAATRNSYSAAIQLAHS